MAGGRLVPGRAGRRLAARPPARRAAATASTRSCWSRSAARCCSPAALVLLRALALADSAARARARRFLMQTRHKVAAVALGAFVGFVLGITSAGSGTLIAIGLIIGFRLSPHRVVGTDVVHAAVLLWVAALAHMVSGQHRLRAGGHDPDRLGPGRLDRRAPVARGCRRTCAAAGARHRAAGVGPRRCSARPALEMPASPCSIGVPIAARRGLRHRAAAAPRTARPVEVARDRRDRDPPAGPRGRGDPHHPRGRGRAREAGAAVLRRQGLDRAAAPGREGVPAGAGAVPGHARRHRPQLPGGDRVPRPPRAAT